MTELQTQLVKMYKDFIEEISKTDIDWVLYAGNALGAVRNSGWIPWDDDMDIAISAKDRQKVIDLFKKSEKFDILIPFENNYHLTFIKILSKEFFYETTRNGKPVKEPIWIDIFSIFNRDKPRKRFSDNFWTNYLWARNFVGRKKSLLNYLKKPMKLVPMWIIKRSISKNYKNTESKYPFEDTKYSKPLIGADVTQVVYFDFCGIKSPIFKNYDEYFTSRYDENWRIPHTEDQRWTHAVFEPAKKED